MSKSQRETPLRYSALDRFSSAASVEGAELSVLQTLNFHRHPVRVLVVERPTPAVTRLLEARGFNDLRVTYDSGGDRVFVNSQFF